jgi:cytochrome c5
MGRILALALATLAAVGACAHGGGGAPGLTDGATLYRRSCGSCHRLKAPGEHDAETWRRAVERFGARLDPAERGRIVEYLTAGAR